LRIKETLIVLLFQTAKTHESVNITLLCTLKRFAKRRLRQAKPSQTASKLTKTLTQRTVLCAKRSKLPCTLQAKCAKGCAKLTKTLTQPSSQLLTSHTLLQALKAKTCSGLLPSHGLLQALHTQTGSSLLSGKALLLPSLCSANLLPKTSKTHLTSHLS
jgi:hypothetical protein